MRKRLILLLSIFILVFSFSYNTNALDCPSCACKQLSGFDEDVVHTGWEGTLNRCPEGTYPICGYYDMDTCEGQHYCACKQYEGGNVCGNGAINAGEECDGNNLNQKTCSDFGYNRGTLRCTTPDNVGNGCKFDTSLCYYASDQIDFRLSISPPRALRNVNVGENLICPLDSQEISVNLMNVDDEQRSANNIVIYDYVYYDQNCDGLGDLYLSPNQFNCGTLTYGQSCIRTYDLTYYLQGCYYHNAYVYGVPV